MSKKWKISNVDLSMIQIQIPCKFLRLMLLGLICGWSSLSCEPSSGQTGEAGSVNSMRQPDQPWRVAFGAVNDRSGDADGRVPPQIAQDPPRSADPQEIPIQTIQQALPGQPPNDGLPNAVSNPLAAHTDHRDQSASNPRVAAVGRTMDKLPNSAGQVWREYDITPYTSRISSTDTPQQAIVDWILRETGKEMWFHHPMGILNATQFRLYVYHTPEVQARIQPLIDRFVASGGDLQSFEISMMTIEKPNWRSSAYSMLQPIETRSLGVEAWLISKENAAILQSQLARRYDAKPLQSGISNQHEGQPTKLQQKRPLQFVGRIQWMPELSPPYQPQMTTVDVGYSMSFHFLTDRGGTLEALIDAEIDQIEKLTNVKLDVPGQMGNPQAMNIQVPSVLSWRLNERFRWPSDHVLLVSCGVVSQLELDRLPSSRPPLPLLGDGAKLKRADALMFINYRGPTASAGIRRSANQDLIPLR